MDKFVDKSRNNSSLGEFYTPKHISKALIDVTKAAFGDDFTDRFVIWDCCCGEFALTKELEIENDSDLYCSTLRSVDIRKNRNEKGNKFVYDFLNDDCEQLSDYSERMFGQYKMPENLLDAFNKADGKPILFYINPPYATNAIFGINSDTRGKDFNKNSIKELMSFGTANNQMLANFLYRILLMKRLYANKNIYISIIMPAKYLCMQSYKDFRLEFFKDFKLSRGISYSSSEFGLSGEFSIANLVFEPRLDTSYETEFKLAYYGDVNNSFSYIKDKLLYNIDLDDGERDHYLQEYRNIGNKVAPFVMSCGSNLIENSKGIMYNADALGYYCCYAHNLSNITNKLVTTSFPFSLGGNIEINKRNFRDVLTNFSAMEILISLYRGTDLADNNLLEPDLCSEAYRILQKNCLLVSLFASNTHYVGCTYGGKRYYNKFLHSKKLYEELLWLKVSSVDTMNKCDWFISSELEKDLNSGCIPQHGLDFYSKVNGLFKLAYSRREDFHKIHPEYQVFLDDLGWYQVKFILKEYYPNEYRDVKSVYRMYLQELSDYVFEAGFIRR